ncbi:restriction endonuclease subunit S [Sphingomonas colocasiae]|uniref:Restriction endonuclease subunit S n=1 Tax=Sphingomonas colocasiae TaxID=1848973 RepID=A0ABS7PIB9_9SPHN|nr:restriction endonuclease subunit S [Sphingomonas colocasiae]MBY8821049.1 restriction endonuclease subunit S [Sphingomonas colocasiae]
MSSEALATCQPPLQVEVAPGPPADWQTATLGDVVDTLIAGVSVNADNRQIDDGEIGVLKTSCVSGGQFVPDEHKAVLAGEVDRVRTPVRAGSIIISRMNTPALVGANAYVDQDHPDLFLPDRLWQLRTNHRADCRWLSYSMQSASFRRFIDDIATGTSGSMKNISKERLLQASLALPPLEEQRRIAEVLRSVDEAIAANEAVAVQADRAFQATLIELIGNAPAHWETVRLGQIADLTLGKMLDKKKNRGELRPYLANINVRWGAFDMTDLRHMRFEERELERYGLRCGDIVMCEGGEPGRCALWINEGSDMMIQKALHRIRPQEGVDCHYLYYALVNGVRSGAYDEYMTGSGIKHLPRNQLAKIEVSLPPFDEQQRIADALRMVEQAAATKLDALEQARQIKATLMSDLLSGRVRMPA